MLVVSVTPDSILKSVRPKWQTLVPRRRRVSEIGVDLSDSEHIANVFNKLLGLFRKKRRHCKRPQRRVIGPLSIRPP